MTDTVIVARRFRGPPSSGNGGYCCGLLAAYVGGVAEVTLRAPPPLDRPMAIDHGEAGWALRDGPRVVATAKAATLDLELPKAPSFDEAARCSERFVGFAHHVFPECFVCGPAREDGDGLRIFPGRSADGAFVAAPFVPDAAQADAAGLLAPFSWAALDCPGYFAAAAGEEALLGRMTGELVRVPRVGERCVVVGWALGREGRKIHAATALFDATGEAIGRARQTWIALAS